MSFVGVMSRSSLQGLGPCYQIPTTKSKPLNSTSNVEEAVFSGIQPDEPPSQGRFWSFRPPHATHEVVAIEDDLFLFFWKPIHDRMDVGFGHVHAHGFDPIDLFFAESVQIGGKALFAIPFGGTPSTVPFSRSQIIVT